MKTLISNARLVDPLTGRDEKGVVAIADGRIVSSGAEAPHDFTPERTIDAAGAVGAAGVAVGVAPEDLVVGGTPPLRRDGRALADLDRLHGLDAHERLRDPAVDPAVPVHVRSERDRNVEPEHLDHTTE